MFHGGPKNDNESMHSGSEGLSIKDLLRSKATDMPPELRSVKNQLLHSSQDTRLVGVVKPGKWLYQLSYLLKIPLHASFMASPLDTIYCLTMSAEAYSTLLGNHKRRNIQECMKFLGQCSLGS